MDENRSGLRTLVDILERSRVVHADRPALAMRGRAGRVGWTYTDLGRRADRFADVLATRGIGRGERVLLWASNQPWWAAVFFGCLKVGAVAVPLDARGSADFTRRVADVTRASLLVLGAEQAELLGECPTPCVPIESLESLGDSSTRQTAFVEPSPNDLAEIVFTSGTTGDPKGVMITHANLLSNVLSFDEHVMAVPRYRLLSVLPLSHLFEQSVGLCDVLLAGASVTYVQTLQPSSIFEALVEERITAMLAVPQVLSLFYAGIEREVRKQGKERAWRILHRVASRLPFALRRYLFRTVHRRMGGKFEFFVVGGAFLDPALAARWENMGVKVVQGYGSTECSPGVTATSLDNRRPDSVGRPLSCCQVRVANDGEVLVRGSNVTAGYWENPRATAESFEDGWYKTGDLGFFDHEGYLHLKGRKKNLIVLGNGMNVYPEDVENALAQIAGVRDSVVVGLDRAEADVDVHAVLLLEDAARAADVVKEANRRLASHQRIQSYTVWPEPDFPRTPTLKAKRAPILEHVTQRYAGPARAR